MKCSEVPRILKADGWYVVSQRGSHLKMKHDNKLGIIIFPDHRTKEMAIGTEIAIFKQAKITRK